MPTKYDHSGIFYNWKVTLELFKIAFGFFRHFVIFSSNGAFHRVRLFALRCKRLVRQSLKTCIAIPHVQIPFIVAGKGNVA